MLSAGTLDCMTIAEDLRGTAVACAALAVAPYLERLSPDPTAVAQAAVDATVAFVEQALVCRSNVGGLYHTDAEPDARWADRA
jgi:hypothetical protein